ncbi:LysR family transcriptional regulator (plasmid) [Paracoccus sp. TD-10]|uniref:LysR family transcriptional regulator n=1 Tax=Paracoccus sp. TD-10 TaxID=3395918 RepID=UPI003AAA85C6
MQTAMSAQINLKLIHTFLLVAEHASFREAAAAAGRSQSAISAQVKQLEEQLGTTLMVRTTRRLQLTREGELLLEQARQAVAAMEFGVRSIIETANLRRGRVTLACSPAFAATRLPAILSAFRRDYPGIRIVLKEHKSAELVQAVKSGEADFGVGPELSEPELSFRVIQSEPLLALVPRSLWDGRGDEIELRQLLKLPLIMFHPHTVLWRIVMNAAKALDLEPNIEFLCIQGQTLVALAEAGLGASVLTNSVADLHQVRTCRIVKVIKPALVRDFALIRRLGQRLSPAASRLYDLIEATAEDRQ